MYIFDQELVVEFCLEYIELLSDGYWYFYDNVILCQYWNKSRYDRVSDLYVLLYYDDL